MRKTEKIHGILLCNKIWTIRPYLLLVISAFSIVLNPLFSQEKLGSGSTTLSAKQLEVDKNLCQITPSVTVTADSPENLKLFFKVAWLDKENRNVPAPDKFSLFLKLNDNIESYCSTNQKKLSTKSGLFGKDIELTNSIDIQPAGILDIAPYRNIQFMKDMPPLNMKIIKNTTDPVSLELTLYVGKEKNNSVDIDDKLNPVKWSFILPPKQEESQAGESCSDLEAQYTQKFKENQPQFTFGYFESKSLEIESGNMPVDALYELKSNIYKFQLNITALASLKDEIKNNPSYKKCVELPVLVGSINNYITDPDKIQGIIDKINKAIVNSGEGGGGGGAAEAYTTFKDNIGFFEQSFDDLFKIKMNPQLLNDHEPGYLDNLYQELTTRQKAQDSLLAVLKAAGDKPEYQRNYKMGNEYCNGSLGIIEELSPGSKNNTAAASGQEPEVPATKKSFPILWWILIPVIAIIAGFGVFKYLKWAKKGKSMSNKM